VGWALKMAVMDGAELSAVKPKRLTKGSREVEKTQADSGGERVLSARGLKPMEVLAEVAGKGNLVGGGALGGGHQQLKPPGSGLALYRHQTGILAAAPDQQNESAFQIDRRLNFSKPSGTFAVRLIRDSPCRFSGLALIQCVYSRRLNGAGREEIIDWVDAAVDS